MQFGKLPGCACAVLFTLIVLASLALAAEMSKDEVDFHKRVYVDKKTGAQMPYRVYVPTAYSKTEQYPLIL
jgi:predicted peptidase